MSSSSNSRTAECPLPATCCGQPEKSAKNEICSFGRRRLLLGLAGLPFAAYANPDPTAGLRRWGSGEFRRFGFLVYEAALWAGEDPLRPPLALKLTYKRNIAGQAIAEASVKEIRNLGIADDGRMI